MLREGDSGEKKRRQHAATDMGLELARQLSEYSSVVQWIIEKNRSMNQSEIGSLLHEVSQHQRVSVESVPSVVQGIVVYHTSLRTTFEQCRLAVHQILHTKATIRELGENRHRTLSEAAKGRKQVLRKRDQESDFSDEELQELLDAMRASTHSSSDGRYKMNEILDYIGFTNVQVGDPEYDRIRRQIRKIASSVRSFQKDQFDGSISPLAREDGITLLRIIRMRAAWRGGGEPNWEFILSEMNRCAGHEVTRDACARYISDVRAVSYSKRGKGKRKRE